MKDRLLEIYRILLEAYGPQHWWPGETAFEMMIGAILTQNTSWTNVEKAIRSLKARRLLSPAGIHGVRKSSLASAIRSSGYFRVKAVRVKAFVDFLWERYDADIARMSRENLSRVREELLQVKGIGPETADSILLYGLKKPIFVVDAYTKRIFSRHGMISEKASYDEVQRVFMGRLPHDERLFNEYHALIVRTGKMVCKSNPKCDICPLSSMEHRA